MNNEILRIIGRHTRDVISVFDAGFRRLFISASIYDLAGYTVPEMSEMDVNAPIPPEDRIRVQPIVMEALTRGEECLVEHRLRCKNGQLIWIEVLVQPILEDNTLKWILTSARNITERKMNEAGPEKESRITESLLDLAIISHEIKNPLSALMNASEMLLKEKDLSSQRSLARVMRASGTVLMTVVNNVLLYSKIVNGDTRLSENTFRPRALLTDIFRAYKLLAQKKGIRFKATWQNIPTWIHMDSGKLTQIVVNILDNAFKFTANGRVDAQITVMQDQATFFLVVKIIDTGTGLSKDARRHLFQPFSPNSISTAGNPGVGLGLYVVNSLLKLTDGKIDIDSSPNGTNVTIKMPFRLSAPGRRQRKSIRNVKVLLVEDVPVQQLVIQEALVGQGARCDVVPSLRVAEAKMALNRYDVIMIDIRNPVDTYAAMKLFISKYHRHAMLIAMSAYLTNEVRTELLHAGASEVMLKTGQTRDLVEAISRVSKTSSENDAHWSLNIYDQLYRHDPGKYMEAIALLKVELHNFIESMELYLVARDAVKIKDQLHKLIPISRQLEFKPLITMLQSCYDAAEHEDWKNIGLQLRRINAILRQFLVVLSVKEPELHQISTYHPF